MARPPRSTSEPLFGARMLTVALVQGVVVFAAVLGVYLWSVLSGADDPAVRVLTFTTLVVANLGLIFVNRSWTDTVLAGLRRRNAALWLVTAGTLLVLASLLVFGPARDLFRFAAAAPLQLLIAALAGIVSVSWFEVWKVAVRRRPRTAG